MDTTERAREVFASDAYAALTGVQIAAVEPHGCRCSLTLTDHHRNARGVAMGGVLFTLADFAAAVAANTDCLADGQLQWVSLDATIHYLSPASCSALAAHSTAVKHGRSTALYRTEITSLDSGKLLAAVETTMVHV